MYRLQVQISVWLEIPKRHPNVRHKGSGRTTVRSAFQISLKIFPKLSRVWAVLPCLPDGSSLAAHNFHIKAWRIRTTTFAVWTANLMHEIAIYEAWAFGPWRPSSGRLNFECTTCLMNERIRTGIHIVRTVVAVFPYLCFGKKSQSWSNTEWRLDVLLKCPDRCKLEQFEASRHMGRSERKVLIVQTDDAWTVERPDKISHRPEGCKGSDFSDL
jgi:hypothetical protein